MHTAAVRNCLELFQAMLFEGVDAILTNVERSVANVDPMKYKCWSTKKLKQVLK